MRFLTKFLVLLSQRNDVMLAVLLVSVIFMMILPLPTWLVDILIGGNMAMAVVLMMLAVYIHSPLEFSAFPSVLLLTTLFRLSLSITTTRLILLQADAGQIIHTFGDFVVGGNLVVGLVIFLIITIVQFVVITKGSERVAEVSARFSLDAMPGKQMSIDGDLRAGTIDVEEAKERRTLIEKESQLYGSMDGAMKFVKGDAIAGLIIIVVNILGGVGIGVMQRGMTGGEALEVYSILTIGDGLVAQIPALFISITAGIIVTRVTNEDSQDLGSDIGHQVIRQPQALVIGGVLLLLFALIPGFPTLTFLALALIVGGGGLYVLLKRKREAMQGQTDAGSGHFISPTSSKGAAGAKDKPSSLEEKEEISLTVPLIVELDAKLKSALDTNALNDELVKIRHALYLDLGVPFPGIHLRFNEAVEDDQYSMLLQEVPVARGSIYSDKILVTEEPVQCEMLNIAYEKADPFLPDIDTIWVDDSYEQVFRDNSLTFMKPHGILAYHLSHVLKEYCGEFIGIQEARFLMEEMEKSHSELVKEVQRSLPLHKMTDVLQRLVSEGISIRNLRAIFEALIEWGQKEKDVVQLTEYVRTFLKRYISYKFSNGMNILVVFVVDQSVEDVVRNGVRQTSAGSYLALEPDVTQKIMANVERTIGDYQKLPNKPVLLTAMDIRRYVKKMVEVKFPDLPVLSHQELTEEINVQPLGRIVM